MEIIVIGSESGCLCEESGETWDNVFACECEECDKKREWLKWKAKVTDKDLQTQEIW